MSQVITNAFEQYWQSSLTTEQPVVLDEIVLADIPNLDITSPIDPDTGLPPEGQIVHRQTVDQRGRVNNNAVAYTIVMDTTIGDFSFNAMYLRNKQNGVIGMIVYKGRETKLKTDQTTGQTGNSLVKSMLMGYDQAAEATLTHVDAGTWQIDYAARLHGQDEDLRQLASQLYGHHTFIGDGFKVVQQDGDHLVTQGVAIVGGLRIELKAPEVIYPGSKPIGVWVDVYRAGSLLSEHQNHFTIVTSVADLTDHVDNNGHKHFVAKLGTVQADSTVVDDRGNTGDTSLHDALARLEAMDGMLDLKIWEALRRSYEDAGYHLRPFRESFSRGGTLTADRDVLLDDMTGIAYSGVGPYPREVAPGTEPDSADFVDRSSALSVNGNAYSTVAEVATGKFSVGQSVAITDRANGVFKIVSGGQVNGFNILPAGAGKAAILAETVKDIRYFGGIDDFDGENGTNNKAVIDYLISLRPITIRLPKTRTGVYRYSGEATPSTVDFSGVVLDIDEGVSIYSDGTSNGPFWRKGVKVNREMKSRVGGARYDLYLGPEQYAAPSAQLSRLTAGDGVISTPRHIDFASNDVKCYQLSAWPDGSLTPITPESATTADLNLGTLSATSFKVAGVPVVPGDFIQANVDANTVRPCLFVQTEDGWVIVQQPPYAPYDLQVQFSGGAANTFTIKDDIFKQLEYRLSRAAMGIIIYGSHSFGICINGIVIKRINTPKGIIRAGWGAGFDSGKVTINRPNAIYRKRSVGIKPLKIVVVGDSTSAETLPPTQSQYMKQYLAGSCGAQVWDMKNLAVGGQTSSQQLASLRATDITGYDYCLIQVGVNDVQGAVAPLTYLNNVLAMIDYCNANSVTPIVGLPTQWYLQSDAKLYGQDGQATGNSFLAPSYRNTLMHGLAARGGVLMNTSVLEDTGAVLAQLLSKPGLDPVMQDNIHPTAYGQMAMGMSYAKAIIGHLTGHMSESLGIKMPVDWFVATIGAGGATPIMFFDGSRVSTCHYLVVNGVSINNGMVVGNIPERLRPLKTVVSTCVATTADSNVLMPTPVGQLVFHEDGRILAYNIPASTYYLAVDAAWTIR
ncbi:phage tail protein [Aeromonas caviae]|uniref:phage tail-collar fiber domain-containing protein n=1 Tax=Aeromonas caviae TaxID=648 RepID=UPI0029D6746F|nr:phage tail protein [Aeromonas caviae]MDX7826982.1 phage tail protein [Aeromonas caviae]